MSYIFPPGQTLKSKAWRLDGEYFFPPGETLKSKAYKCEGDIYARIQRIFIVINN